MPSRAGLVDDVPVAWLMELLEFYRDNAEMEERDGRPEYAAIWHERAGNLGRWMQRKEIAR